MWISINEDVPPTNSMVYVITIFGQHADATRNDMGVWSIHLAKHSYLCPDDGIKMWQRLPSDENE